MDLERRVAKLTQILAVAKAMTVERDLDKLLGIIVEAARNVVDADRCTLFIRDRETGELWSKVAHGLETREIRLPIGRGIAGYVAMHDTVLNIADPYGDTRFNKQTDAITGYRTRAILCAPMRGPRGEVVGVLQALNPVESETPFDEADEELLLALGGQAAAAIQNAFLYESIDRTFEGLVRASIVAIESRDPATSGHSERVAAMTVALAEAVNETDDGPWASTRFSDKELRELRYSTLLHDMGKVGVREHVLTKPTKLLPDQMDRLRTRLEVARAGIARDHYKNLAELDARHGEQRAALEASLADANDELDDICEFLERANQPRPLSEEDRARLDDIATKTLPTGDGHGPILTEHEHEMLSIGRGTLSREERSEIESHVSHSYNFLVQIPWTEDLQRVPEIAWGHHEKLNGRGYPRGVSAEDIPVETRMMTIADIYDALTASDRPYKKAMSHERAISILEMERDEGGIDAALLDIFIEADVPGRALGPDSPTRRPDVDGRG